MNIRVKYRVSCIFLIVSILAAGMLPGCKTQQAKQTKQAGNNARPVTQKDKQSIPLRPISKDILQLAKETGADIKNFQFYISTTIELTQDRKSRLMEVDEAGNIIVETILRPGAIKINKETKGTYITAIPNANNPAILEICFDQDNEKNTLFFAASPDGRHFDLKLYYEEPQTVKYGGKMYNLSFPEPPFPDPDPPQLLIRFDEKLLSRPDVRIVSGRSVKSE